VFSVCAALSKGCLIFSKVRSGKIYVNDLPVVLHALKISTSDSEVRQALKAVSIDGKLSHPARMNVSYVYLVNYR
jgi:hypothetical protein